MQWRILAALAALVPAIVLALRDGKLQPGELDELGQRLAEALARLVLKP